MTDHKKLFELAIEASNDGIWDWNIKTGQVYFSPQYFTMLGYDVDQFPHSLETWESLLHPDDKEPVKSSIFEHIERGEQFNVRFRLKNAFGSWQWILGRGKIMDFGDDGKPSRMVGTHVDIHQQTLLLEQVNAKNNELQLLNRLGEKVTRGGTIHSIVLSTMDILRTTLENDLVLIFLVEEKQIVSRWISSEYGSFDTIHEKRWDVGDCLCGLAVADDRPVFSLNVAADRRCANDDCIKAGIKSFAAIPLKVDSRIIGVLGVGSKKHEQYDLRKDFLNSIASVIASGVNNAILHGKLAEANNDLETLYKEKKQDASKLLHAIENTSVSVLITDEKGFIEYVNPFFSELTGFSSEEAIGQKPNILRSDVHDSNFYERMWDTLLRQESWHGDICNRKKDGTLYWEHAVISPFINSEDATVNYIAVKEDITRRKRSEEELRILSEAINNSASSVIVTDNQGDIIYVNPSFSRLTGYSAKEAIGKTPRILKSGLHDESYYRNIWSTIAAGKSWHGELLNKRKDGKRFWMSVTISPIQSKEGTITRYVGVQNDVTEKKELELLKEDVDRIMRHDLKTPLNAIIGFPPLIEMDGNLNEDQLELTQAISKSATKMLRMIDCSLALFKIETGKYDKPPVRVELIKILREVLFEFKSHISAKQIVVTQNLNGVPLQGDESYIFLADEGLVHSLLSDLLSNAFEASPSGGNLSIDISCCDKCCISIINAGVVPVEIRSTFFQKYKTYGKNSGTGFGTYSAKKIAEAMGFSLSMETSDELNMTTLTIQIPSEKCIGNEEELRGGLGSSDH